jgi:DNA polymerase-3 subunit delta
MDPRVKALEMALAQASPRGLYVLAGDDELALKEALRVVEQACSRTGAIDRDTFDLDEQPVDSGIDAACTRPMWSSRRLVVLKSNKGLDEPTAKRLTDYGSNPAPFSTVVLVLRKLDLRTAFAKAAKKLDALVELSAPKAQDLPMLVQAMAQEEGVTVEPGAVRALIDAVGVDPLGLRTNLLKVITFVGELRPIREADVDAVVARTRDEVVWDLTDALGTRNAAKALSTLHGMLERGESGIVILAVVARHFRQLWRVQALLQEGKGPDDVASAAGIHPFVAKKLAQQSRLFPSRRLAGMFTRFHQVDRALKSSKLEESFHLERLVVELCT